MDEMKSESQENDQLFTTIITLQRLSSFCVIVFKDRLCHLIHLPFPSSMHEDIRQTDNFEIPQPNCMFTRGISVLCIIRHCWINKLQIELTSKVFMNPQALPPSWTISQAWLPMWSRNILTQRR